MVYLEPQSYTFSVLSEVGLKKVQSLGVANKAVPHFYIASFSASWISLSG
ncbi:MAG: hypothetical protein ACRC0A_06060 [Chitinophagaceae bacterium]